MADDDNIEPPLTIASLRAIRERKRQLIARPPAKPSGHTHRVFEDHLFIYQEKDKGDAVRGEENVEHVSLYDTLVSTSDDLGIEVITSVIAALHSIEPMGLKHNAAQKFRQKKRFGLGLLQAVLAQRLSTERMAATPTCPTETPKGDTTNEVEKHRMTEAEVMKELRNPHSTISPEQIAHSMLHHPQIITITAVQALGRHMKQENRAHEEATKLLRAGEGQQEALELSEWLEDGVQKHSQVMSAEADQFEAGRSSNSKLFSSSAHSVPRSVVPGKRSAPTHLPSNHRSYTGRHPLASETKIDDVVAEDADPALVAMWQVIPDLQKEAMRDIETQVVMPTVVEYLSIVKRRKLGTLATEHGMSMEYQL